MTHSVNYILFITAHPIESSVLSTLLGQHDGGFGNELGSRS